MNLNNHPTPAHGLLAEVIAKAAELLYERDHGVDVDLSDILDTTTAEESA